MNATPVYVDWLNSLQTSADLMADRFREVPIIQPTWLMSRRTFMLTGEYWNSLGEDLAWIYRHIDNGGTLCKTSKILLVYRYIPTSLSSKNNRKELFRIKATAFERQVLTQPSWEKFYIWGSGRDAKAFYNFLGSETQKRVAGMIEISKTKHGHRYPLRTPVFTIIIKPEDAEKGVPCVVCVNRDRFDELSSNVDKLGLSMGNDLFYFC
eukprot:TRINITY_DN35832_c0_g1_i1.p1 TRINITY_DN35832_c0_g1~~TRINITY_DN35832_c0_g1_i1.p1  ORF type:complete len:209 (-),score=1.98 TRINITY_DN35832_c0_g1_i1:33-659(-)